MVVFLKRPVRQVLRIQKGRRHIQTYVLDCFFAVSYTWTRGHTTWADVIKQYEPYLRAVSVEHVGLCKKRSLERRETCSITRHLGRVESRVSLYLGIQGRNAGVHMFGM